MKCIAPILIVLMLSACNPVSAVQNAMLPQATLDTSETCLVLHAVTPVQVCRNHQTHKHQLHFLGGEHGHESPLLPSFAELEARYPDSHKSDYVELYRSVSGGMGKDTVVSYAVRDKLIVILTSFTSPQSNENRLYVFNISADGTVTHTAW